MKSLELYIHIPFCVRKCDYCDFLSFPTGEAEREQYVTQLCREICAAGKEADGKYRVSTLFFGGGTPSLLDEFQVQRIMEAVYASFPVADDAEITMEMNPGTLGEHEEGNRRLAGYKKAGINRVSLGVQSSDNAELKRLGRIHTWEQFLTSFKRVREAGFDNVNLDLMSALPGQTEESWESTLRKAALLGVEHISAYSLIVEEGTPFYERYSGKGEALLPDEETEREMYRRTKEILAEFGYHRYEISNYAKEGRECRHNMGYWTGVEYLGIGLGASSYYGGKRFCNVSGMKEYLEMDFAAGQAKIKAQNTECVPAAAELRGVRNMWKIPETLREEVHIVTEQESVEEFMFLGLRLMKGVSISEFSTRFHRKIESVYGGWLDKFCGMGLLEKTEGEDPCYRLTEEGISVSNQVMCEFLEPELGPRETEE